MMKQIMVLGTGCKICEAIAKLIETAAKQAGVGIELTMVTDVAEIMAVGVMFTPGEVVDGELVHARGLPAPDDVRRWVAEP